MPNAVETVKALRFLDLPKEHQERIQFKLRKSHKKWVQARRAKDLTFRFQGFTVRIGFTTPFNDWFWIADNDVSPGPVKFSLTGNHLSSRSRAKRAALRTVFRHVFGHVASS